MVTSDPEAEALAGEGREGSVTRRSGHSEVLAEVVTHVLLHHGHAGHAGHVGDRGEVVPVLGPLVLLEVTPGGEELATLCAGDLSFVRSVLTDSLQHKHKVKLVQTNTKKIPMCQYLAQSIVVVGGR